MGGTNRLRMARPNDNNDNKFKNPQVAATEKELIDMRELNFKLPFDNIDGGAWKQGWDVQPAKVDKDHPLTIYVVPHSHCDPGWIKTFDEYFQSQTKYILSTVISSLHRDPRRKFIWAEISYFEWWWKEQKLPTKDIVRGLLANGQFEFVTGGWVQTDEANTQLYAMEIQLQEGHDFIRTTFGDEYVPKFGWSIDPFGYSPTMAYLLKKYNFQAMLIQRVHYAIKKELALHKQLEFMWRQTWDKTGEYDIFTHVMPFYSYDVPHTCGPDPSVCCQFDFARIPSLGVGPRIARCPWHKDAQPIHDNNVAMRAQMLLDQYQKKANLYRTNVVIAPLGDDFRWETMLEADAQFENYQRIFDWINANVPNVSIQWGTLSDYFNKVLGTFEPPVLKGSFFTYSDREQDYWSGYFTSRVFDKALDRVLERVLYAAMSMGATKEELQTSRRSLSLFQHHDGVTGTAKDPVVRDYAKRIHTAIRDCQDWMIAKLKLQHTHSSTANLQPCWQSDAPRGMSQNLCPITQSIVVYNPLDTPQSCGTTVVTGRMSAVVSLPCEVPGPLANNDAKVAITFDSKTGLMTHPIREQWMVWKVREGGAYLFFPGTLESYTNKDGIQMDITIEQNGFVVTTPSWKRTIVQKEIPAGVGGLTATVFDFVYETNLQEPNEEWFVRFSSDDIANLGVFHTDLNGYNFDTHHFRKDMPIQSQVFPMPTLASIEDAHQRLTILSEHAQGTASLEEGSIDVWLDRRLMQDDNRGLGQGVRDNVPTRTRLRVLLEHDGYDPASPEFEITPLAKRMWKELNHPLEWFGTTIDTSAANNGLQVNNNNNNNNKVSSPLSKSSSSVYVPLVYMVYNRVDYLKRAIDSLRVSDFPKDHVPIIISHDGHIPEMVAYVDALKAEFLVIQLFHPHACHDHPNSFPGDDPRLNENYRGDRYGNPREGHITCCKHHFTWMMNEVYKLKEVEQAEAFLFLEEDYIVAPTIYETIHNGLALLKKQPAGQFFGMTLDPTDGYTAGVPSLKEPMFLHRCFVTGPMVMSRDVYNKIARNAQEYCTFDDYNWYVLFLLFFGGGGDSSFVLCFGVENSIFFVLFFIGCCCLLGGNILS